MQKLLIVRTDVEPWQEIQLSAVRRGETPAAGSYAVAARRYCQSQQDLEVFTSENTDWFLLPSNALTAYDFHDFAWRCAFGNLFVPARNGLIATERNLMARIRETFPRSAKLRNELYGKGLAYVEAGRIDDAEEMLKAGDAAMDSGAEVGTLQRSEGSRTATIVGSSDVLANRNRLVRDIERARGPAGESPRQ